MSSKERDVQTSLRLPQGLVNRIDEYISADPQFNSRTGLIVEAIRHYLDYRIELKAKELAMSKANSEVTEGNRQTTSGRT